jgi:hypothetical protein
MNSESGNKKGTGAPRVFGDEDTGNDSRESAHWSAQFAPRDKKGLAALF